MARDRGSVPVAAADAPSFEEALESLEALVARLENGELELDGALAAFEEGVRLTRRCADLLAAAERRIEILSSDGNGLDTRRPFDSSEEGG